VLAGMIANFLRLTAPWVAGSSPLPSRHIRGGGWLEFGDAHLIAG